MSFDSTERSTQDSSPRELYQFFQGSNSWAFTGADEDVMFGGVLYTKASLARSEADFSQERDAAGIDITLPASNAVVQPYVGFQPSAPLLVIVHRVHRDGHAVTAFSGRVTNVSIDGPEATLTCVPLGGDFSRRVPSLTYQSQCNWALYGPGCQVNRELFKTTATITQANGFQLQASEFAAQADGWFTHGYVELVHGERAGDRRFITEHAGSLITLSAPFSEKLIGNVLVHAFAGCDRTITTCQNKFNNIIHHLGFARIPVINPHTGRMA